VIPYLDLKAQYRAIQPEIDQAVLGVLASAEYVLGSEVAQFEKEFAAFSGAAHGVGMSSGTAALHMALLAAGIGAGDEVITVPYTFVATTAAIRYTGARPVFVDIDPVTYMIDVAQIESRITPRTKAIVPVHLYGQMCDMDPILALARKHNLVVIEDAAQAHGAEYKGRRAGSMGDMAAFSFYPGKNLGAYGEGGLVTTQSPAHADKLRLLRNWGTEQRYYHKLQGYNLRMDGIQGAVLRVKLRYLEQWTDARRANAALYTQWLAGHLTTPEALAERRHVYHVYAIRVGNRAEVTKAFDAAQIQYGIHYPEPIHLCEAHADLGGKRGDFPIAEQVCAEILSLPLFPEMTREQIETVANVIKGVAR
jgi:dTDP-4-amino-4,6-dideoxygalactose transaminase